MKNIFKTLIIAFSLIFMQSCDEELIQLPNNSLSPSTYYNTSADFEAAIRGVYSGFLNGAYYGGSLLSRPDIMTDNVILAQVGRRSNQSFYEWRQSPNLSWDMMSSPYIVTNRANLIIENLSKLPDGTEKDNFEGEARTARALALFDMLKVYCKIPTQSANANDGLGMPIITEVDPSIRKLRPTVAESYSFVISELEAAKTLINTDNGVGRFNKNAVNALLSRAYLYTGQYPQAVTAANAVTANVAALSTFPQVWVDSSEDGVIMKINQDRILDGVGIGIEWSQSVNNTVRPEYVMDFDLFNMYTSDDVRKTSYAQLKQDSNGNIYNAITKMYGEAGQSNGVVDPKIIRAAEVYLNKAEAYAKMTGKDVEALAALDAVRSKRYTNFVSGGETGTALLDAIKKERRLELFAEGHRWFDIKRWGESISRSTTNGEFFDGTGTPAPSAYTNLAAGSYLFELPIPQNEINVYPEFQQNPNY
jgi:starch-binding outer membrane protein, SusD/RagB family